MKLRNLLVFSLLFFYCEQNQTKKQGDNNLSSNDYGLAATPPTRTYFGPVDIQKLKIQLLDDYGRIVDMNNMDISIAINLDCLVDN